MYTENHTATLITKPCDLEPPMSLNVTAKTLGKKQGKVEIFCISRIPGLVMKELETPKDVTIGS